MERDELKRRLFKDIFDNDGADSVQILRHFHSNGGKQRVAYDVLDEFLDPAKEVSEELEDLVLDIMDLVVGFCHSDNRIWDEYLDVN